MKKSHLRPCSSLGKDTLTQSKSLKPGLQVLARKAVKGLLQTKKKTFRFTPLPQQIVKLEIETPAPHITNHSSFGSARGRT